MKHIKQKSILFVCTGNIFRSLSAEYAFKKYLSDNKITNWKVGSAGIVAKKEPIDAKTLQVLNKLGVKNIHHKQRKLTKKLLNEYDVVIAIAKNHEDFIKSKLKHKCVLLFNEAAINEKSSIWDINDEIKDYATNRKAVEKKIEKTVIYIFKKIPSLFKNVSLRYYLFVDFINNMITHRNGFPFMMLYETKNTVSFMSIDIPSKEDGHILVIPKKRYVDFSDIPKPVLNDLISSVQKIGIAISLNHGGYNVLLNNSTDAGQYIFHTHFHIIPRNYNDGIKIEEWSNKNLSLNDFIKLNKVLLKQIKSLK
ncbi:MAG: HIT domain-containing protein [Candidatus Woesearchaeota archaeon]|jgi:protein-tyrosine phosphatase